MKNRKESAEKSENFGQRNFFFFLAKFNLRATQDDELKAKVNS